MFVAIVLLFLLFSKTPFEKFKGAVENGNVTFTLQKGEQIETLELVSSSYDESNEKLSIALKGQQSNLELDYINGKLPFVGYKIMGAYAMVSTGPEGWPYEETELPLTGTLRVEY